LRASDAGKGICVYLAALRPLCNQDRASSVPRVNREKKSVYKEDRFDEDRKLLKAPQLVTIYTNSVAIGSQKPRIDLD
jgi:hypothetical protein